MTASPSITATAKPVRHFPAHLAPIDRYWLLDDVPRFPMTYVIQMECEGAFDRDHLEHAFAEATLRHPYLRAKIGAGKRGMLSWVDGGGDLPAIDWGGYDDPMTLPGGEAIDLRAEVGLRVWVRQDDARSKVLFQWHHSVTDGTGAFRFMGDVLVIYDQLQGGESSKMLPLDPTLLRERRARMARHFTAADKPAVRRAIWRLIRDVFTRWAAPLVPAAGGGEATFPGIMLHTYSKEDTAALRDAADGRRVMLNDILLERFYQAMREWNKRNGGTSRRPFRIMMPTDLRESSETEMPAANMVSCTFLTRPPRDCDDAEALLRSIANETDLIKHAQRGKDFIDVITAAEAVPWCIPWLLRRGWCLSSGVVTNNGDPARRMNARLPRDAGRIAAGGVVVTRFSGVPPLREQTNVVLAAMTYAKQLTLTVRCSPHGFDDAQSRAFLDLYVRLLDEYRQRPTETPQSPGCTAPAAS